MKITKITLIENKPFIQNKNQTNTSQHSMLVSNSIMCGYKDFNINFRGRTPENFYEQEFNIKYMPDTMKKFLNADYDERKHIPPEQIMSESFKFLAVTDNLADVKSTYPDEPLFANLHEASLKGRSGILSDIKLAKEMSDTPLFNDGEDNFGIYLLRKIYLEGKTIKEINKDFYEKDLNPEYKGVISQPITYSTTSAYGIQYPKTDFWNSFIATREEYKKFFVNLPKHNKTELQKELVKMHSTPSDKPTTEEKKHVRKYTIKKYQKDQITKGIIKSKGDEKAIKNVITGRFTKDDPEAAFIVKYLSPIMIVAADKIHLSEEMKNFAELTKSENQQSETFFARFWKARPEVLKHYSTAITDSIELFEETYGEGGLIPINNEFQIISKEVENQKTIDYVPQRFIELLNYTKTIIPNREKAYSIHDEEQAKWNEHFLWRYGEVKPEEPVETIKEENKTPLELLEQTAAQNNAKVYTLRGANGEEFHITANLDETLGDYLRRKYVGHPSKFVNFLIKKALNNPFMTEQAKLSFSTIQIADQLDDENILGEAERTYIMNAVNSEVRPELIAATMATLDVFALRSSQPYSIYRTTLPNQTDKDTDEYNSILYKTQKEPKIDDELNSLYDLYRKPLSNSEITKLTMLVMDYIRNFDAQFASTEKSTLYRKSDFVNDLKFYKEIFKHDKNFKQEIKQQISTIVSKLYLGRGLLLKQWSPGQRVAKTETYAYMILKPIFKSGITNLKR